ncbi:TVP38/TMEM64 family protein [Psychrobacillus antarcticus]|uniref:TVP38/TMEM64 family protein n=1 Tax=Psychrobacillus antarcticus TaxID=2879115 RepID=UPI002407DE7F|nr:VTT domain-containing protein [Psychrobacillus antarcticus]
MYEFLQFIQSQNIAIKFILLLLLNLGIGAVGFVPSFFITAININSLGLVVGSILTFTGEILGALIGFYLYRWGFSKVQSKWFNHTFLRVTKNGSSKDVFRLIILFRLLPFVPSGLITAGASLTSIKAGLFMIASTIGKIPAVILEVALVFGVLQKVSMNYIYISIILICIVGLSIWINNKRKETM